MFLIVPLRRSPKYMFEIQPKILYIFPLLYIESVRYDVSNWCDVYLRCDKLIETLKNVTLPKVSSGLSKILVPIDESKPSIKALELAIDLATRYESEICLVSIIPTYQLCHWLTVSGGIFCSDAMFVPSVIMREMEKESKSLLISALTLVQSAGIESYAIIGKGYPANEIVRIAKEEEVDLIVIGSNKPNIFVRLLFGSISQAVARKASCPVLIVKREKPDEKQNDK